MPVFLLHQAECDIIVFPNESVLPLSCLGDVDGDFCPTVS